MLLGIFDLVGNLGIGHLLGRVKHPQPEPCPEEPLDGTVNDCFIDEPLLDGLA